MADYVPDQGDFIAITFNPQAGHEQQGRRPALVLSKELFNRRTGMAMVCPITNRDRDTPFQVAIPDEVGVTGFVMVEQIKSLDLDAREAEWIGTAPAEVLDEVLAILDACLY